ncbi:glycosyltransferase family 4 protein [Aliarcobacter butzleri]|uniref:glycosyltransferase family 4 protein n=1 Tax=Aliarcobacter butzleri TaxID=28197 RepID=UPI003AF98917
MEIVYIANSTIPSTSANSVHVMKVCEAFSINGVDIKLIIPNIRDKKIKENEFDFYGVTNKFKLIRNKLINETTSGIWNPLFALTSVFITLIDNQNVIFTRSPFVSIFCIIFRKRHFLELHGRLHAYSFKLFKLFKLFNSNKLLKIVVISQPLKKIYIDEFNVQEEKILVLPDGVTYENFEPFNGKEPFNSSSFNIGYVGSLWKGKGIEMIISIARKLPYHKFNIYGGEDHQIVALKEEIELLNLNNIFFYGHVANSKVPNVLCEQDILLMPNQKQIFARGMKENIAEFTSPLKMFEYMASGRVIISSDMPVLREILNENNSFLVPCDDVEAWIQTIKNIENNIELARKIALRGKEDVQNYTWTKRAKRIIEAINER